MAKSPAFQFYANDFMDATSTWEANAVGLYVRCLCKQWTHGAIPSDLKILARAIHCDREELERCWDVLAPKFVKLEDGTLINKRLEAVRERHEYVSSKRSEAGKAGAIAKANAKANAVVLPLSNDKQRKVKEKDVFNSGENGTREAKSTPEPITWPSWAGPKTKAAWEDFKNYRLAEHKARYKSLRTEQLAVNALVRYFPSGPALVAALEHSQARSWRFPVDPAEHKYPAPPAAEGASAESSGLKFYRV